MGTHTIGPRRAAGTACALLLALAAMAAEAAPFTNVVAFGDSLTDTGNLYEVTSQPFNALLLRLLFPELNPPVPPPPYYQGRFSNGPVWLEHLAFGLGLAAPIASERGGLNYAVGGATTGDDGNFLINLVLPDDVEDQVSAYLDSRAPSGAELFVVQGGANDLLSGGITDVNVPVGNLGAFIADLHRAGGRRFLVPNLPPLGRIPSKVNGPDAATLDARSAAFNAALEARLDGLEATLGGIEIFRVDLFGAVQEVLADPAAFGFGDVTHPAYDADSGSVVPYPDRYLFWDDIHPTAPAHALFGRLALAAIPEPATLCRLGLAAPLLAPSRRRGRAA